jgi:hypothetical protein
VKTAHGLLLLLLSLQLLRGTNGGGELGLCAATQNVASTPAKQRRNLTKKREAGNESLLSTTLSEFADRS